MKTILCSQHSKPWQKAARRSDPTPAGGGPDYSTCPALVDTASGAFWADNMGHFLTQLVRDGERVTDVDRIALTEGSEDGSACEVGTPRPALQGQDSIDGAWPVT